ncbi:sodium potassium calcium exchanger 1-like isoform X2 [Pelobates cultripes]|uniref:Sodium/potassium/calcium exchanger 1 n=1 Tax=Pelobates cultripes TaxID=61616 RepID=A0AAD1RMF3_PELCU|nr:sodium potassium calcium exchanger 1-like isoform X2 [Pelobates cultripes]
MYLRRRKRLQWNRIVFIICVMFLCSLYQLSLDQKLDSEPWRETVVEDPSSPREKEEELKVSIRELLNQTTRRTSTTTSTTTSKTTSTTSTTTTFISTTSSTSASSTSNVTERTKTRHCIFVEPDPVTSTLKPTITTSLATTSKPPLPHAKGEYPRDLFSIEQRRNGWVSLHIFGMMYVFVALAIVCDEFFVPALGVITEKLQISEDVAGATFMAAGGSAPELFTSLIGVFISHSNVGIGTIVGSAVFNILFVIGTCALFSREILNLTWWPLFRDVSFYIIDLIMLIIFFLDNVILWWESMLLLTAYGLYVIFMKINVQVEGWVKSQLSKRKQLVKVMALEDTSKKGNGSVAGDEPKPPEDNNRLKLKPFLTRGGSSASLHNSTIRSTIFQLMIHTLDPLGEDEKDGGEVPIVNVQVTPPTGSEPSKDAEDEGQDQEEAKKGTGDQGDGGDSSGGSDDGSDDDSDDDDDDSDSDDDDDDSDEEEDIDEPLSLEWPDTKRKQITYLLLLPIIFPLWLTVPDVRSPKSRKYFVLTFLGSIMWIAIFSYLMVWWAHQVGETIGISEEIMGLTILAAGTSIPDLITSVIVARKGLGDMAVSSSVGSNIFDITVGLPAPWFMFSMFNGFSPVAVSSNGLFCAIVLLFLMLLFVIFSIAFCKWRMNKFLGFTMFILYFVFVIVSVMLEDRIIVCPVSI